MQNEKPVKIDLKEFLYQPNALHAVDEKQLSNCACVTAANDDDRIVVIFENGEFSELKNEPKTIKMLSNYMTFQQPAGEEI